MLNSDLWVQSGKTRGDFRCFVMNEIGSGSVMLMASFCLIILMELVVGGFSTSSLVTLGHTPHNLCKTENLINV